MCEIHEQIILICTTINLAIIISCIVNWIIEKIHDHKRCKKQKRK